MTANVQSSAANVGASVFFFFVCAITTATENGANGRHGVAPADKCRKGAQAQAPQAAMVRADLPGSLDHASAEVDEFDAALVAGAGGVPAPARLVAEAAIEAEELGEATSGETCLRSPTGAGGRAAARRRWPAAATGPERPPARRARGNRAIAFLRASWAELQRVQWPDRRQVTQATAVVLGFVAIAGVYLGLADYVAKEIVEFIL